MKTFCEMNLVDVLDDGRVVRLGHPESVYKVVLQNSVSTQIRQLILYTSNRKG